MRRVLLQAVTASSLQQFVFTYTITANSWPMLNLCWAGVADGGVTVVSFLSRSSLKQNQIRNRPVGVQGLGAIFL